MDVKGAVREIREGKMDEADLLKYRSHNLEILDEEGRWDEDGKDNVRRVRLSQ